MKQKVFKIFTLILALAAIVIACQKELEDIVDNRDDGFFTVEQAKAWYEAKASEYIELKSGKAGQKRVEATPDWENAEKASNKEFEVVETPLNSKGSFVLVAENTCQSWNDMKQQGMHATSIRMVIRYNRKLNVKESFLMTMVPDKEWLQKNPKRLKTSSYVNRPKGYSGLVLYHTLAGDFVNGWKYTDGKVTHTAVAAEEEEESKLILKSSTCSSYIVTGYFQDCTTSSWTSMGEYGEYTECGPVYSAYVGSYTICYYSGGDGDYVGNTGGNTEGSGSSYVAQSGDEFAVTNISQTMLPQLANMCVTSIMEYINHELCNGSVTEGDYVLSYYSSYFVWVNQEGVLVVNIESFVKKHFYTQSFHDFDYEIDRGNMVMTDIASPIPGSSHNVAVVGYHPNGDLIYMDPETGTLMQAPVSAFNQNYAISIDSCK